VTRGPSLVPGEKRLAVEVEDHPVEYGTFERTIPKDQYGGGSVIMWDRGTWEPVGDPHKGLVKGQIDFRLYGEKLKGRWHLVRMAPRCGEKRKNWLLIKGRDEEARGSSDPDILVEEPQSIVSWRTIEEIGGEDEVWDSSAPSGGEFAAASNAAQKHALKPAVASRSTARAATAAADPTPAGYAAIKGAAKAPMPGFIAPCLATLRPKPPEGEDWVHEIKFDGYRLQPHIEAGKVTLFTRGGLDRAGKFGLAVTQALAALPIASAIIDGELVAEGKTGVSDFSLLQEALSENQSERFRFYACDLLYAGGYDLRKAALLDRKAALEARLANADEPLRFSSHLNEGGPWCCKMPAAWVSRASSRNSG
jgi:bifunctional non-homologous end joining protein LigD